MNICHYSDAKLALEAGKHCLLEKVHDLGTLRHHYIPTHHLVLLLRRQRKLKRHGFWDQNGYGVDMDADNGIASNPQRSRMEDLDDPRQVQKLILDGRYIQSSLIPRQTKRTPS